MIKQTLFFFFLFPLYLFSQTPIEKGLSSISKDAAQLYIGVLASDSLEGRQAGSDGGGIKAAEYLRGIFKEIGLKPWKKDYFQIFDASSRAPYKGLSMRNVLGYIEGRNSDEIVIIGAIMIIWA